MEGKLSTIFGGVCVRYLGILKIGFRYFSEKHCFRAIAVMFDADRRMEK